jgi:hypothetical protein
MTQRSSRGTTDGRPQRLYVYKLTTDDGGAPCVWDNMLSLAICKPRIRTTAEAGDWVFGFAAKQLSPDEYRLIYIAEVTEVIRCGEYYENARFKNRPDRIYVRGGDGRFGVRRRARYHAEGRQLRHDLGDEYEYPRATVLLSDDFRYFGGRSVVDIYRYPEIATMLATLTQGHRVNHPGARERELRRLKRWAWQKFSTPVLGEPSQRPDLSGNHCGSCSSGRTTPRARAPGVR